MGRVFPLAPGVLGKSLALEAGLHADAGPGPGPGQGLKGDDAAVLVEVVTHHKLTSRGADAMEDVKRAAPSGSSGANGSEGLTGTRNPSTER